MSEQIRLELGTLLEGRDGSRAGKDGLLTNCYKEQNPEGLMVIKRPGLSPIGTFSGCTGQGAYYYGGRAIFIACDTLNIVTFYVMATATVNAGAA